MVRLGAFELGPEIGQGGMGRVFRGRHARSGVPVAIKVLAAERARDPAFCASFRDEVRAVASLDHPGIVRVFDQGRVEPEASLASHRQLGIGAPFLVMELLEHGTLNDLGRGPDGTRRPMRFPVLRAVLLDLLDALAHAHARGVVHRDLKPGNVLLTGGDAPAVKLTDFGIAHRLDETARGPEGVGEEDRHSVSGTPHYMAPEQAEGRRRELGPWTDLYALGCVAWRLATGRPPFHEAGNDVAETLRRQVNEPPPAFESLAPVPPAFRAWLSTLLAKPCGARFRCAADAAAVLAEIPLEPASPVEELAFDLGDGLALPATEDQATRVAAARSRSEEPLPRRYALAAERTVAWSEPATQEPTLVFVPTESERPPPASVIVGRVPALPLAHRPPTQARPSAALVGAGLGLFAVRPGVMVDRDRERDALWAALAKVHEAQRPHAVVVRGASGVGKTRLLDWFSTRAREVGGATVLHAVHGPSAGSADGLGPMLARRLRTNGLSRRAALDPTLAEVRRFGGRLLEAVPLLEITHPLGSDDADDGPRVRFAHPRERAHAIVRYLELLARERPVMLRIDDAQWGLAALELVEAVLAATSTRGLAVLCVLDVLDVAEGALPPREAELVARVTAAAEVAEVIEVRPLSPDDQTALVEGLLALRPQLAREVVSRSGGHPLFAVQLVADWVQRGLLQPEDDGFALVDGAERGDELHVPDSLHALLLGRLGRALPDTLPRERALASLERAAVLGRTFAADEWARACAPMSADAPLDELGAALKLHGLLVREDEHLGFSHGMIVESLVRRARDGGRLADHHRACAAAISSGSGPASRERSARHLAMAGDLEAALGPMFEAAWERFQTSDYRAALTMLEERDGWFDRLALPAADPRRAEGWLRLALVHARTGRLGEATSLLDRVDAWAKANGHATLDAEALAGRAKVAQMARRIPESVELFERAIALFSSLDHARGLAQAEHGLAEVLKQGGRASESEPHYTRALEAYARVGDRFGEASCLLGFAELVNRTDRPRGGRLLDEAEVGLRNSGNRLGLAIAEQVRALSARYEGRLDEAHAAFFRCSEQLEAIGSPDAAVARTNAAVLDVMLGRWARATRTLEETRRIFAAHGRDGDSCFAAVELLACRAHARNWSSFDELLAEIEVLLPSSGLFDEDLEICLRIAREEALEAHEATRAQRVLPLLQAQQQALTKP